MLGVPVDDIRTGVLRASIPTHKREAWYREQLRRGIDVAICHPKIVETGLDLFSRHRLDKAHATAVGRCRRAWPRCSCSVPVPRLLKIATYPPKYAEALESCCHCSCAQITRLACSDVIDITAGTASVSYHALVCFAVCGARH